MTEYGSYANTPRKVTEIILNVMFMIPSAVFCGLVGYFCTLYNQARENGVSLYSNGAAVIASMGFMVCVFVIAYYRVKYPRLFTASLQGLPLPFFALTRNIIFGTSYDVLLPIGIVYPTLIGAAIAFVVNIVVFPETAAKQSE